MEDLPLHLVLPHRVVRHLAALHLVVQHLVELHPVVTVGGNESQSGDGLARKNWHWRSRLHLLDARGDTF